MNKKTSPVFVLTAPSACGKTQASLELASAFPSSLEIINLDSIAFYQDLPILSAAPSLQEQQNIPHHLFGIFPIPKEINANIYCELAREKIQEILSRNKIPLLVGGTGFYLKALQNGMFPSDNKNPEIKKELQNRLQTEGITPLYEELLQKDPVCGKKYHPNDHYRILRALEHLYTHHTLFSSLKGEGENSFRFHHFHMNLPVEELNPRIIQRIETMIKNGAIEEVETILKKYGPSSQARALNSVGVKEILAYLQGKIPNLQECKNQMFISTRQLAKSQRTWFNSQHGNLEKYHAIIEKEKMISIISQQLRELIREMMHER